MKRRFTLYTNRNCTVYNPDGTQDAVAQSVVSCYHVDRVAAQDVLDRCHEFFISKFGEWSMPVLKEEIEYLLGLRTRERDISDMQMQLLRGGVEK